MILFKLKNGNCNELILKNESIGLFIIALGKTAGAESKGQDQRRMLSLTA